MDELDYETMDELGYFYLTLALVPRTWYDRQDQPISLESDDYRSPTPVWWRHDKCKIDYRQYCDERWERADPSGTYLSDELNEFFWADTNDHRVESIEDDEGHLIELAVLIDVRNPWSDFLDEAISFARTSASVFFEYGELEFIDPRRDTVSKAINEFEMTHAKFDSSGRLLQH